MDNKALYRVHRPKSFDQVIGQELIVNTLKNAITHKKTTHAYLFSGPRGTGKTSLAKIFAKTINCITPIDGNPCNECSNCNSINRNQELDIIEMDAASNRGIDDIRELIESSYVPPAVINNKVYIIDEAHMLTTQAFNALLKTLEEPPKNVVFILATTEPHKLPNTILSRCQRYDFQRIEERKLCHLLEDVASKAGVNLDSAASATIAKLAKGGARDALSMLDQIISFTDEITQENIMKLLGNVSPIHIVELIKNFSEKSNILNTLEHFKNIGVNPSSMCDTMINVLRDIIIFINTENTDFLKHLDQANVIDAIKLNGSLEYYKELVKHTLECKSNLKHSDNAWEIMELFLLNASNIDVVDSEKIIYSKVVYVESNVIKHVEAPMSAPINDNQPTEELTPSITEEYVDEDIIEETIDVIEDEVINTDEIMDEENQEEVEEPEFVVEEEIVIEEELNVEQPIEEIEETFEEPVQQEVESHNEEQLAFEFDTESVHSHLDKLEYETHADDFATQQIEKSAVISTSVLRGSKYNADEDGIVRIGVEEKFHVDKIKNTSLEETQVLFDIKKPEVQQRQPTAEEVIINDDLAIEANLSEALNYIVQSDKEMLENIKDRWHVLKDYQSHPNTMKVSSLLLKGKPVLSCEHGLILVYEHEPDANIMNGNNKDHKVLNFMKEVFGTRLLVIALETDTWTKAKSNYLMLRQANKLPKPVKVQLPENTVQTEKNTYVDNLKNVFGEIVEEEQ